MDRKGWPNLPLADINCRQQWEQGTSAMLGWCCLQRRPRLMPEGEQLFYMVYMVIGQEGMTLK